MVWQPIGPEAAASLEPALQPYFFCIEALRQNRPGRYLYADADTLCVRGLSALGICPSTCHVLWRLALTGTHTDRSLVLGWNHRFITSMPG